jgi:4-hydroxy-tetrahydrodipicolinate synthase
MDGVISVAANALPQEFSDMVRAGLKNDFANAKKINDVLIDAYNLMFAENNPAGVKAFLYELGIIENEVRLPVVPLSEALHKKVKLYLNK